MPPDFSGGIFLRQFSAGVYDCFFGRYETLTFISASKRCCFKTGLFSVRAESFARASFLVLLS